MHLLSGLLQNVITSEILNLVRSAITSVEVMFFAYLRC